MTGRLWVSLAGEGSLVALDLTHGREICRVRGLGNPGRIAVGGGRAFVVDAADGTLSCVDESGTHIFHTPAAPGPTALCLSEDGTRIYVGGGESESVTVFDAQDGAPLAINRVPGEPKSLDVRGGRVLVACAAHLLWLDSNTLEILESRLMSLPLCGAAFCPEGVAAALVHGEMSGGLLCLVEGADSREWTLPAAPLILRRGKKLLLAMDELVGTAGLKPWSLELFPLEGWADDIDEDANGLIVADGARDTIWRSSPRGLVSFYRGGRPVAIAVQESSASPRKSSRKAIR